MGEKIDLIIEPREKDLGGFSVRRVLPYHKRRMVGPFIFFDHMGPAEFKAGDGINVRPHPHIGLSTVTYLFDGVILHRDTEGNEIEIAPGACNWMTAGRGIVHSERTPERFLENGQRLHGIQTWVALPKTHEEIEPDFTHHPADSLPKFELDGARATLIAGDAFGYSSPVDFPWGIFYVSVETGATPAKFLLPEEIEERCVYVVEGEAVVDGEKLTEGMMAILLPDGAPQVTVSPHTKIMLAGGEPMDGKRVMDWNLVSSSRERIDQAIEDWRSSAENWWEGSVFKMPPNENEYIPYPGDEQLEPR